MDKKKGKSKGRRRNGRRSPKAAGVVKAITPQVKPVDPLVELLAILRTNPGVDGIKNIVDYVSEERSEYFNLGKAVRGIMNRNLTDEEEVLVKKLGANA
jgi:hypothetical protein